MSTHVVQYEPEQDEAFVETLSDCVARNFALVWGDGESMSRVPIFAGTEIECQSFLADTTSVMAA